ncbi:MAG: hypothetical protein ACREYC_16695 [Gammaproteobacteria bacterium]
MRIVDFVLSCRVMGRKVEETMLAAAVHYARALGLEGVVARYLPTAKNKPCLDFFTRSGFRQETEAVFTRDAREPFHFPTELTIALPSSGLREQPASTLRRV